MYVDVYIYIHRCIHIYIYIYIYIGGLGELVRFIRPPVTWRSASFRACRASGRGKAVRAHVERDPYRLASRVLGSTCCALLSASIFCAQVRGFNQLLALC